MGELGNQFTQAVSTQSYEYLKGLDFEQIKGSLEDRAEFVCGITEIVLEETESISLTRKFKSMIDFLIEIDEETTLHNMMFQGLDDALKRLSSEITNLV